MSILYRIIFKTRSRQLYCSYDMQHGLGTTKFVAQSDQHIYCQHIKKSIKIAHFIDKHSVSSQNRAQGHTCRLKGSGSRWIGESPEGSFRKSHKLLY